MCIVQVFWCLRNIHDWRFTFVQNTIYMRISTISIFVLCMCDTTNWCGVRYLWICDQLLSTMWHGALLWKGLTNRQLTPPCSYLSTKSLVRWYSLREASLRFPVRQVTQCMCAICHNQGVLVKIFSPAGGRCGFSDLQGKSAGCGCHPFLMLQIVKLISMKSHRLAQFSTIFFGKCSTHSSQKNKIGCHVTACTKIRPYRRSWRFIQSTSLVPCKDKGKFWNMVILKLIWRSWYMAILELLLCEDSESITLLVNIIRWYLSFCTTIILLLLHKATNLVI